MTDAPPPQPGARAFVDESYRSAGDDAGLYLFAAVTIPAPHEVEARERLKRALPRRVDRFHWHNDRAEVRLRLLDVIATLDVIGLTFLQLQVTPGNEESARQHMLWSLAFEMLHRGVTDLVFEARDPALNRRDEQTLSSISRTPAAVGLRHTFARAVDEPLLWLPDYLAGAHGAARHEGGPDWLELLPLNLVEIIEVPPRRP